MSLNVPLVVRENATAVNCRMVASVGIIIILLLVLSQTETRIPEPTVEGMSMIENNTYIHVPQSEYYTTDPVEGRFVVIRNNNKKSLPIDRIVVVGADRDMQYYKRKHAIIQKSGKHGVAFIFKLPRDTLISQIILDTNIFCEDQKNMHASHVEIRDGDFKSVWNNTDPLEIGIRYIFVYVQKPKIIHGDPQSVLCNGLPSCAQENKLNLQLQRDIWN